ncbi:hypothetical protein A2U01_0043770, partial [Trifolium medium]|nr:hypothetical protein [Trifolium medium]
MQMRVFYITGNQTKQLQPLPYYQHTIHRSEVGSSCASGGKGVARAELDELDGVDTDSDASGGCQREVPFGVQVASGSTGFKQQERLGVEKSTEVSGCGKVIPSTNPHLKATDDNALLDPHVLLR